MDNSSHLSMKIFFVGANTYDRFIIEGASREHDVAICDSVDFPHDPRIRFISHRKSFSNLQAWLTARGNQLSLPFFLYGLCCTLKKEKPDIILVHDFFRLWFLQALWYRIWHPDVKLIIRSETQRYPHGLFQKLFMFKMVMITKLSSRWISRIITFTEYGKLFCERRFRVPVTCIPIAINTDLFKPNEPRIYGNPPCILVVARYVPYKGHLLLLDALKRIESLPWQATFVDSTRSDYQRSVYLRAQKLGIDKRITWDSNRYVPEQMKAIFSDHDILVLPSYGEAIGAVVPEAMACGCATITSDTVGANVYVDNDKTGLTFKTGDAEQLAQALTTIMANNTYELYGRRAADRIHSSFSMKKIITLFNDTVAL